MTAANHIQGKGLYESNRLTGQLGSLIRLVQNGGLQWTGPRPVVITALPVQGIMTLSKRLTLSTENFRGHTRHWALIYTLLILI